MDTYSLLDFFKVDCDLRNLTSKTVSCYMERMGYFIKYLNNSERSINEVNRSIIDFCGNCVILTGILRFNLLMVNKT